MIVLGRFVDDFLVGKMLSFSVSVQELRIIIQMLHEHDLVAEFVARLGAEPLKVGDDVLAAREGVYFSVASMLLTQGGQTPQLDAILDQFQRDVDRVRELVQIFDDAENKEQIEDLVEVVSQENDTVQYLFYQLVEYGQDQMKKEKIGDPFEDFPGMDDQLLN